MAANRLPASWMNALDPAAGARLSRLTAARAGAPRCPYISRRSRPASGQTLTVPSSFRRGELPRRLRAPFARNVIPGAHAADRLVLALVLTVVPLVAEGQQAGKVHRVGAILNSHPHEGLAREESVPFTASQPSYRQRLGAKRDNQVPSSTRIDSSSGTAKEVITSSCP